jgi:uncharacterized membrane protein YgcG
MVRTVKIYTLVLALITSACLVFAFEANHRADAAARQKAAWEAEVTQWRATTRNVLRQNQAVVRENKRLAKRYDKVVVDARRLVRAAVKADRARTLAAARRAAAARPTYVYTGGGSSSSGGGGSSSSSSGGGSSSSSGGGASAAPAPAPAAPSSGTS